MLEKLRDNPRAVVVALITAGLIAIVVGASGNNPDSSDVSQEERADSAEMESVDDGDTATEQESTSETGEDTATESDAHEEGDAHEESTHESTPPEVTESEGSVSATVRKGDNQTVIVRQMVENYLNRESQTLSDAQKLYVETKLVAQLPRKDVVHPGEIVTVESARIADLVGSSRELSDAAVQRWAAYL